MKVKDYLSQAYRLDQRIKFDQEELKQVRELSTSVYSPGFEEHLNASRNTDAPYIYALEKIMKWESIINTELMQLMALKREMCQIIDQVPNMDECLVLKYRYIKNYTWARIGDELGADESTIRRWHNKALNHITLPENPTIL